MKIRSESELDRSVEERSEITKDKRKFVDCLTRSGPVAWELALPLVYQCLLLEIRLLVLLKCHHR